MKYKFRNWGISVLLFVVGALYFGATQLPVQLIAEGNVPIYGRLESAANGEGEVIFFAKKGDQFAILKCHDLKSVFVLEVDVGSGKRGFVFYGDYQMSRMPVC